MATSMVSKTMNPGSNPGSPVKRLAQAGGRANRADPVGLAGHVLERPRRLVVVIGEVDRVLDAALPELVELLGGR